VGKDPLTGKPRQRSRTFKGGKRQAVRALTDFVSEVSKELVVSGHARTVADMLERWLDELNRLDRSPLYVSSARYVVEARLIPALGHIPLTKLTAEHLDLFYGQEAKGSKSLPPLAPDTIHLHHAYLKSALAMAVRYDWLPRSPALKASPPGGPGRAIVSPPVEDVLAILEAATRSRSELASLLFVAATTGLRRGELCGLRWSDVDLDSGTMLVERGVVQFRGETVVKAPKSDRSRRLSIDDATVARLREHLALSEGRWAVNSDGYIWSHYPGNTQPISPSSVTRFFMRMRDQCDLPHIRLHDLRHFSVTQLLSAGVDVRTVSGRHGHRSGTMTLNRYGHFMQSADVEAAKIMGELLRPTEPTAQ
jgi:integrase